MHGLKTALAALSLASAPLVRGQGGGADFVFVYDNSGSMWSHYAKIDTLAGDTAYYHSQGCAAGGGGPVGTPFTYMTLMGPRTIQWIDSTHTCSMPAGDPYLARTAVISRAIDFLAARFPNSTAGAIGFGHETGHARSPLPLSEPGNAAQVKASLELDSLPATYYVPPLNLALSWLHDTSLIGNARQAIVFLSDGEPGDTSQLSLWLNYAANTAIPIHSIAFGDTTVPAFLRMQDLSSRTGGDYYCIPPEDVSRMNQVIEEIILRAASAPAALRPARGPRAGSGASRPAVDAAGRRVPAATPAPGIRFPQPR